MVDPRQSVGRRGEELASAFLVTKGFHVIGRNWHCRYGEIDLIVQRQQDIRFVEVKTRRTTTYGYPEEAVTRTKMKRLQKTVAWWLSVHEIPRTYSLDVIAISLDKTGKVDLRWIEAVL